MKRNIPSVAICLTAVYLLSGCASIISDNKWPVTIHSNPSGAICTVINQKNGMEIQKGRTPMTVTLSSKAGFFQPANYQFRFDQDGYNSATTSLSAGMNPWYIGNIAFGGLIGFLIVDPATGSMWKLNDAVHGNLSPLTLTRPIANQE